MDLKKYDTKTAMEEGRKLHLIGPDGYELSTDDAPVTITLQGMHSAAFKRAVATALAVEAKRKKVKLENLTADDRLRLIEDNLAAQCRQFAAVTLAWQGIEEGDKPVPCTVKEAERIYMQYPWIRDQVATFIATEANYLGNG